MEIGAEEANRVATLVKYSIMDTDAEEPFDRLAEIAAELFDAPIALVSLVDGYRQWFKSRVGLSAQEMPRDWAFCARTIELKDVLVIPDVSKDAVFRSSPMAARGPSIRFFAGAPLMTADGHALGAVCILDRRARKPLTGNERRLLRHLADMVMEQIELRRGLRRIRVSVQKLARLEKQRGGGPVGQQVQAECDTALAALDAVRELSARSARKHGRLMTPKHAAKKAAGDARGSESRRGGAARGGERRRGSERRGSD